MASLRTDKLTFTMFMSKVCLANKFTLLKKKPLW